MEKRKQGDIAINLFKTRDFPLAATLCALNYKIICLERPLEQPERLLFLFVDTDSLKRDLMEYKNAMIRVEPRNFFYQQKLIKRLINDFIGEKK